MEAWRPAHPDLQRSLLPALAPELTAALASSGGQVLTPVGPDLYRLPLLRPEACQALLADLASYERWAEARGRAIEPPNSMHSYGVLLDPLGYRAALAELVAEVVRPLASQVFPEVGGASLDEHHGFLVEYGPTKDTDLDFHVDNSEVTLNLCLGESFVGGALYFRGRRCPRHRQSPHCVVEEVEVEHRPGTAILHAGAHRHGVWPLQHGQRKNLIVWCSSRRFRQSPARAACAEWCGVHEPALVSR